MHETMVVNVPEAAADLAAHVKEQVGRQRRSARLVPFLETSSNGSAGAELLASLRVATVSLQLAHSVCRTNAYFGNKIEICIRVNTMIIRSCNSKTVVSEAI